jgi:hypothetical protein
MSVEPGIVDTNVLVYALDADAPQHAAARALLDAARTCVPRSISCAESRQVFTGGDEYSWRLQPRIPKYKHGRAGNARKLKAFFTLTKQRYPGMIAPLLRSDSRWPLPT